MAGLFFMNVDVDGWSCSNYCAAMIKRPREFQRSLLVYSRASEIIPAQLALDFLCGKNKSSLFKLLFNWILFYS